MSAQRMAATILACAALVAALAVSVYSATTVRARAAHGRLLQRLPAESAGWQVRDLPVATSEEMARALVDCLNYDGAVFREYRRGSHAIWVYAAHWRPGKFHPRLIATHTPDVCWQSSGWKITSQDDRQAIEQGSTTYHPAHFRIFNRGDTKAQVIFWHVVDGQPSGYVEGQQTKGRSFLDGWWRDWRQAQGEQFFIRISATSPWEGWLDESLMQDILKTFEPVLATR